MRVKPIYPSYFFFLVIDKLRFNYSKYQITNLNLYLNLVQNGDFMLKKIVIFKVRYTIVIIIILIGLVGMCDNLGENGNIFLSALNNDHEQVMVYENYPSNDNSTDNDDIESIDDDKDVFYYLFGPLCPLWLFILVVVGIISYYYHRKYVYQKDIKYIPPGPPPNQSAFPMHPHNVQYPQYPQYPQPQQYPTNQQAQNLCSYCQQPLTFYEPYQKWYCNNCKRYV